jgi:hypothetical protein
LALRAPAPPQDLADHPQDGRPLRASLPRRPFLDTPPVPRRTGCRLGAYKTLRRRVLRYAWKGKRCYFSTAGPPGFASLLLRPRANSEDLEEFVSSAEGQCGSESSALGLGPAGTGSASRPCRPSTGWSSAPGLSSSSASPPPHS